MKLDYERKKKQPAEPARPAGYHLPSILLAMVVVIAAACWKTGCKPTHMPGSGNQWQLDQSMPP